MATVTLESGVFTVDDLGGNPNVTQAGRNIHVDGDLVLSDNATLIIEDAALSVSGSKIQVDEGCTLRFGRYVGGHITHGAMLYAPNLTLGYGFGSASIVNGRTASGRLEAYGSRLDARCFWGFFGPQSSVDIRHCSINGFGRATGSGSTLDTVVFDAADGRYGILAAYGAFDKVADITVTQAERNAGHESGFYLNPAYTTYVEVKDSTIDTPQLCYCENGKATAVFIDCDINNTECYFASSSTCVIELRRTIWVQSSAPRLTFTSAGRSVTVPHAGGLRSYEVTYGVITRTSSTIDTSITVVGDTVSYCPVDGTAFVVDADDYQASNTVILS